MMNIPLVWLRPFLTEQIASASRHLSFKSFSGLHRLETWFGRSGPNDLFGCDFFVEPGRIQDGQLAAVDFDQSFRLEAA